MKAFAALFADLDTRTSTNAKVDALARYFGQVAAVGAHADAAWAVYFLAGGKPRAVVNSRALRDFALAASGVPDWLFEECYQAVGDLAETIAHLLPPPERTDTVGLAEWIEGRLLPLRGLPPADVLARLHAYGSELDAAGRFLLIKLIGGGFRVGVSKLLVTRALARHSGVDAKRVAERLVGYTDINTFPTAERYLALITPDDDAAAHGEAGKAVRGGTPYPFFLAHQLDAPPDRFDAVLGPADAWLIEWKYDGIRAQLVRRGDDVWLWSRGEDLITERFPEIVAAARGLPPGTVLDGEILVWDDGAEVPGAFARLQTRITRKAVTPKIQREHPARFVAYDLLEADGVDQRGAPQRERRVGLEQHIAALGSARIGLSPRICAQDWPSFGELRAQSRARGVEGLMLKHLDSAYGTGRTKADGTWWKWKIEPLTADAVLVYAQRGHGRRASLYTDYTFAVWDRAPASAEEANAALDAVVSVSAETSLPKLVPFAKAYSGLTDEEIRQVDAVIRKTTVEKFGPVRTVRPTLLFELGFEGIQASPRHKSGIAVRFPRMLRWRTDKPLAEADTLGSLRGLLAMYGAGGSAAQASPASAPTSRDGAGVTDMAANGDADVIRPAVSDV